MLQSKRGGSLHRLVSSAFAASAGPSDCGTYCGLLSCCCCHLQATCLEGWTLLSAELHGLLWCHAVYAVQASSVSASRYVTQLVTLRRLKVEAGRDVLLNWLLHAVSHKRNHASIVYG